MVRCLAALEQGLVVDEKSDRLARAEQHDDGGPSPPPDSEDNRRKDSSRVTIFIRGVLVTALFLAGITLGSGTTWGFDQGCPPNACCQGRSTPLGSIEIAPPRPECMSNDPNFTKAIPHYVLDHSPYVYLHDKEQFWPCDIAEHLLHTTPELNYTPIENESQPAPNLTNLDRLNAYERGRHVFLTSNDNVEDRPEWLSGRQNTPDDFGKGESSRVGTASQSGGGRSSAPAVLITVDKGNGIVDAFWFFFYCYNLGNIVFNIRWGNHVGDWEHVMVRFQHGIPKVVFFSEHSFGSAYTYAAVEKINRRPVVYSAIGTHAMYATPGSKPYILPLGLLHDETSRGPLWDPSLNLHSYQYDPQTDRLTPSALTPTSPREWFFFNGKWGDKSYPLDDDRQYGLVGEYHYVNGPLGPRFKNLGRRRVCQGREEDPCPIKDRLEAFGEEEVVWAGEGGGGGEDWSEEPELRPPGT